MRLAKKWADEIHAKVLDRIVDGQLRPGDLLGELAIAEEFGVSRTPVREALQRLAAEGLAERGARRAFVVRRMHGDELQDLFETLGEIEALVVRLAALRMTELERQTLRDIVEMGEIDSTDYAASNVRFHEALQRGAKNAVLSSVLRDLQRRSLPWRDAQFRARAERVRSSQEEHRSILEAVLAQDGDLAYRRMREHMASSLRVVSELMTVQGGHGAQGDAGG